jgi:hypothetical protein
MGPLDGPSPAEGSARSRAQESAGQWSTATAKVAGLALRRCSGWWNGSAGCSGSADAGQWPRRPGPIVRPRIRVSVRSAVARFHRRSARTGNRWLGRIRSRPDGKGLMAPARYDRRFFSTREVPPMPLIIPAVPDHRAVLHDRDVRDHRALPKAHLHVHLEGVMRPDTLKHLAAGSRVTVPPPLEPRHVRRFRRSLCGGHRGAPGAR